MSEQWIRASEIADYAYCRRSWWLKRVRRVRVRPTPAMQAGTQAHRDHGGLVVRATLARKAVYLLLFFAIAVTVFTLLR